MRVSGRTDQSPRHGDTGAPSSMTGAKSMPMPSYNWSITSGAVAAVLTILAVAAYSLISADLNTAFMIGYVTAISATVVEVLRTRRSISWTWFGFLNAA